jgi:hypothetical protein
MPNHDSETPPQPSTPLVAPTPPRNILALIAFIVAAVGFVLACIPGILIVGWVLLPISFVLSIVSLFLKGSGKRWGIAGLVTSVVGTIVAIVVAVVFVGFAVMTAVGNSQTVGVSESAPAAGSSATAPAAGSSTAKVGTKENPSKIPATITSEDWTVVVNSYKVDGKALVNPDMLPPAGSHYEVVNFTVTYKGKTSSMAGFVTVDVVTSKGTVVEGVMTPFLVVDRAPLGELFTGGTATGSFGYEVPDGDKVTIRVTPGRMANEVFVKP